MPATFPLKVAPPAYIAALEQCWLAAGYPGGKRCLIGVDGFDASGKSSFAAWLAWQLGSPCLFLDTFLAPLTLPLAWRLDDIERLISARLDQGRVVVLEGVCLLDVLGQLGREPDLLVYVESELRDVDDAMEEVAAYVVREGLPSRADVVVRWSGEGPIEDRPWSTNKDHKV